MVHYNIHAYLVTQWNPAFQNLQNYLLLSTEKWQKWPSDIQIKETNVSFSVDNKR